MGGGGGGTQQFIMDPLNTGYHTDYSIFFYDLLVSLLYLAVQSANE